ncbi:MAG: protein kinase domain-containing protein [Ktedonobacteraceae bacterium]
MPTLQENQQFERYRIHRWLGNGVSGESYEATDMMLQRKVTLKLIHPWTPLPESARRQFFREMQGISQLHHPYLASVLNYGELDNRLYSVRRYVSNGSLLSAEGRLWYRPPLHVADAIHYGVQLAQALAYIHQQGYLHGSLTFSNLLVLRSGNIDNEADFAPFLVADVGLTNFVCRFGQPSHTYLSLTAAPEQLGKRVTPASDQYALASILYFWLSGRPAFVGSPAEIEHMKLTESITPLSSLNSSITIEQESILRRAFAVYPEERYPSMTSFADALAFSISHEETTGVSAFDQVPNPEPLPQPAPEPLPVPAPEPLPQPAPEPLPQPAPTPLPEPAPEPLPQPAPDVFTSPVPETDPMPLPTPQTDFSNEIVISTQHEEIPEQQPTLQPYLLISLSGTQNDYIFLLEREEIAIGRAGDSDILLEEDALASRHHALLRHEGNHYVLYDLRSASGVFVNGQKLCAEQGYRLTDGNLISIGNYELIFHQIASVTAQEALA